jgi:hypothetical protein
MSVQKKNSQKQREDIAVYQFEVYLPEQSPSTNYPDWEADTLQECIDFIESY